MTDAERDALDWLDDVIRYKHQGYHDGHRELEAPRTLKAMLSRLTVQPTKIVWRVQPEGFPFEDFPAIYAATARASHWLAQDIEVSIRKTEVRT